METAQLEPATDWVRNGLDNIEALKDAVLGAGVDAVQLSAGCMQGSLLFGSDVSYVVSSAHILGRVTLKGPLSRTDTTIGVGLRMENSRQWMKEISSGCIGIYRPEEVHEGVLAPGSLYASVTMADEEWERFAAEQDLVLDHPTLGGSRIMRTGMPQATLDVLRMEFTRLHVDHPSPASHANRISRFMLRSLIALTAREPRHVTGPRYRGYARIAARASHYIEQNLSRPLSISEITRAAFTSQRSLYRAFHETYGETPQSYVRKLRLNRIRRDLASLKEARCTVAMLANRWGVTELGRLSSEYRDLFGELPSRTRPASLRQMQNGLPDLAGTA